MNYQIHKATEKDIDLFFPLFQETVTTKFPEYSKNTLIYLLKLDYSKSKIQNLIKNKESNLFLALQGKIIVGFLLAENSHGGIAFCNWIAVSQHHQKQGLGTKLIQTWEQHALKEGAHKLHLWTEERNVTFYKKQGFTLLGKIPDDYFGADDYIMYKSLRKSNENNFLKDFLRKNGK